MTFKVGDKVTNNGSNGFVNNALKGFGEDYTFTVQRVGQTGYLQLEELMSISPMHSISASGFSPLIEKEIKGMRFEKGDKVVVVKRLKHKYSFMSKVMNIHSVITQRHANAEVELQFEELLQDYPNHKVDAKDFEFAEQPVAPLGDTEHVETRTPASEHSVVAALAGRRRNIYEALEIMEHHDIRRVQNGLGECGYYLGEALRGSTRFNSIEELVEHIAPDNSQAISSKKGEIESLKSYIENKDSLLQALASKKRTGISRLTILENDLQAMIDANR